MSRIDGNVLFFYAPFINNYYFNLFIITDDANVVCAVALTIRILALRALEAKRDSSFNPDATYPLLI